MYVECTNSAICGTGRFCNFDDGISGGCEDCNPDPNWRCEAQGFITQRGTNECNAVCKDSKYLHSSSTVYVEDLICY